MWQCPQCGMEVEDSLKWCWICGAGRTATPHADVPRAWDAAERFQPPPDLIRTIRAIKDARDEGMRPPIAGVPRRFSVGKLMLITAFFAVLFGLMSCLSVPTWVFVTVAVFVAVIGLAQAILYSGKEPRRASVVAGGAVGALTYVGFALAVLISEGLGGIEGALLILLCVAFLAPAGAIAGGVLGYVAGCLVAGLFLRKDSKPSDADDRPSEGADPFAPDGSKTSHSHDL